MKAIIWSSFVFLLKVTLISGQPHNLGGQCGHVFRPNDYDPVLYQHYPWQVIISGVRSQENFTHYNIGGGTVINERWLLSSAQTFLYYQDKNYTYKIRLGSTTFNEDEITIDKIVYHQDTSKNDIALLRLNQSLDFQRKHMFLSPICLANPKDRVLYHNCVSYNYVYMKGISQPLANLLTLIKLNKFTEFKQVNLTLIQDSDCEAEFGHNLDMSNKICAGSVNRLPDKIDCSGDLGDALQCQKVGDETWYQLGIFTGNGTCIYQNKPNVFLNVSAYYDWIEKTISN